ncbi:MAG: MBL fold metallo-hydrolase, partial [bacterium]
MIQEIVSDLYRLEIPLPMSELQSINAYVIRGIERHLIIDTGVNTEECMSAMENALEELDINRDDLDFFITHHHGDHFGLVHRLMSEESTVYIHEEAGRAVERIATGDIMQEVKAFIRLSGIPDEETGRMAPPDTARLFKPDRPFAFKFVKDGEFVQVGEYRFQCVVTPGHAVG